MRAGALPHTRRMRAPWRRLALLWAASLALSACTTVKVVKEYQGGPLPRPHRVLVYDFAYSPGQVDLDRGVSARVAQALDSSPRSAQELDLGRKVAEVVSEHLVKEIREMGLPAQRASGDPDPVGNTLVIKGQFLTIDQGNRTARVVIGLGAGRSDVETEVQVYMESLDGRRLLEELDAEGKSNRKPGMAETLGVGAVMGHLVVSAVVSTVLTGASETFSTSVEADAGRIARKVAAEQKKFFVRQGWVVDE